MKRSSLYPSYVNDYNFWEYTVLQFKNESIQLFINNLFTSINIINIPTQLQNGN